MGAKWERSHPCERQREIGRFHTRAEGMQKRQRWSPWPPAGESWCPQMLEEARSESPGGPGGSRAPLAPGLQWF